MQQPAPVYVSAPAIATSIPLRCFVEVTEPQEEVVVIKLLNKGMALTIPKEKLHYPETQLPPKEDPQFSHELVHFTTLLITKYHPTVGISIAQALKAFIFLYLSLARESLKPVVVKVNSEIPFGAGLGSSAAFNTSLSLAMLIFFQVPGITSEGKITEFGLKLTQKYSYLCEKFMHGNPSGIDNTISTYGGTITFREGKLEHVQVKLPFKVLITDTKVERNTRFLVESVGRLKCNFPSISEFLFDAIDAIALEAKDLLTTVEDRALLESKFKELISLNQHLLNAIGVGHKSIDQVCRVALDHHLPSKLSGAGGGGCAFTFINQDTSPETIDKVVSELRGNGFQCYQVDIGCDGVNLQAPSENFK
eukprot:TRINITY_DN2469_c0_g5_i7.p1 TRINITY_DN2469_c0_g5~~TRINITY_DN2469_c0_g5_i7.p1  ORF type:complete len:364 (+),score=75.34 TRINITY_DN2469_c0_g5_i7:69-1160(+)